MAKSGGASPPLIHPTGQGSCGVADQVRASVASSQLVPDPAHGADSRRFHPTRAFPPPFPSLLQPLVPAGLSRSQAWLCLSLFAWHNEWDRHPFDEKGAEFWKCCRVGGSRNFRDLPIPFPCPSCLWQGQARNEKVTGQIFMKAISSTPDLPRKTSTTPLPTPQQTRVTPTLTLLQVGKLSTRVEMSPCPISSSQGSLP